MRIAPALFALASLAACTYDPPPEVNLGGPADRRYEVGEPIPLVFSEPILAASLELSVWPHEQNTYDAEGRRLPGIEPLLAACTVAGSPCGAAKDVTLTLDEARTTATLDVGPGAFGPPGKPLVLEVKGTLEDDAGRKLNVTRGLAFQVVEPLPPIGDTVDDADASGDDADTAFEPVSVVEGPHLYYSNIDTPIGIALPQQFWADVQVDEATGWWVALFTDADVKQGLNLDKNTSNPDDLTMDLGAEGFIFSATGNITRDADGGLMFVSEPFTLKLTIGPITFALNDAVVRGRITLDADTGLSRWDGLMSIDNLYYSTGSMEKTYTEADGLKPATFQIVQLKPEQVPAGMPRVCDANACVEGLQTCNLAESFTWPPAAMCE